jgi:tetratricopeptide (TPR) repeat protein
LGVALQRLAGLENQTGRLEDAVAAYREALKEFTRERVPVYWATTHGHLGAAFRTLGARESGTARLEEAVAAFREALKERMHVVPLGWATTQYNLGKVLQSLGERESGTTRLDEAVAAYREALKEFRNGGAHEQETETQRDLERVEQTRAARKAAGAASSPTRKG